MALGRLHSADGAGPAATLLDIRADLTVGDGGRFFGGERAGHPVRTVLFSRSIENGPIRAGSPEYDAQWGKLGPERTGRQCGSPLTPYARPNAYAIVIWKQMPRRQVIVEVRGGAAVRPRMPYPEPREASHGEWVVQI